MSSTQALDLGQNKGFKQFNAELEARNAADEDENAYMAAKRQEPGVIELETGALYRVVKAAPEGAKGPFGTYSVLEFAYEIIFSCVVNTKQFQKVCVGAERTWLRAPTRTATAKCRSRPRSRLRPGSLASCLEWTR